MTQLSESKKHIARGTLYLYLRKLFGILLGFYTSRLLLERLGDNDFGLFGLVGSVIVIFSSIRGIFSTSIQRYINVAKATGNVSDVRKIFNVGMTIQVIVAVIFFMAVEIGGLLLIPELNIPPESRGNAWWVFQFSLMAAIVTILTVPYDAIIVAHERFKAFAVLSIIETVLKLSIVILLIVWSTDRIVWYAFLLLCVALIVRGLNLLYCRRSFGMEVRFKRTRDIALFKEMTVFAGWNFLGSTGITIAYNGANFLINIFGGVAMNTARALAVQIQGCIEQFVTDMSTSFQPRSIGTYTRGEMDEFYSLIYWNSKVNFFICSVLSATFICMAEPAIRLWLGEVPAWSVIFTQLILFWCIIRSLHDPINVLFNASGKMKWYQVCECMLMSANIPISWVLLKNGYPCYTVFIVMSAIEIINFGIILLIARHQLAFRLSSYLKKIILPILLALAVMAVIFMLCQDFISTDLNIVETILWTGAVGVVICLSLFIILFNRHEQNKLLALFRLKRNPKI